MHGATGHNEPSPAFIGPLLDLTSALSATLDFHEIAHVVATSGVTALGASAAFVAVPSSDGEALEMLAHVRPEHPEAARNCRLSLDDRLPVVDAYRMGVPVQIATADELYERYPVLDRDRVDRQATACMPLRADGQILGA